MSADPRLVIVANRLPVRRVKTASGSHWEASPGGLVAALAPILRDRRGSWVGWPGYAGPAPEPFEYEGIRQAPVGLSEIDLENFYQGFSNGTLWPLYHDAVRFPEFHRHWWWPYVDVNRRFARTTAEQIGADDVVWVHDYQLQLVPGMLREERPDARIGFFMHIPFPPVELFAQLPWRRQVLDGLLGSDLVGFQTKDGANNFAEAARRYAGAEGEGAELRYHGRSVRAEWFPISIDVTQHEQLARSDEVQRLADLVRAQLGPERRVILGVDRLDYTKGIDVRLRAFETLLGRWENAAEEIVFVQVAVPSREHVPEYAQMRSRIEQDVGRINGRWGEPGRTPVQYLYRSLPPDELAAYYKIADVMAVTPLRDGMNLVAKEYVVSRLEDTGVLVLSEFAGAAEELTQALQVNPHDIDGLAAVLEQALELPPDEVRERMGALRATVRENDVHDWSDAFLARLTP